MAQAPKKADSAPIPQHKRMAMGMPVNQPVSGVPTAKTKA